MEQSEKDKTPITPIKIGHFQNEDDVIIGDYVAVENPHSEQVKKSNTLSPTPTSELKKKIAVQTLEDHLRDSWLDEKALKDIGLKRCSGFFRKPSYHFFKDSKSAIYFFEKHQEKDEYKLFFMVSPYGKG